jgi:hypothetical protein
MDTENIILLYVQKIRTVRSVRLSSQNFHKLINYIYN